MRQEKNEENSETEGRKIKKKKSVGREKEGKRIRLKSVCGKKNERKKKKSNLNRCCGWDGEKWSRRKR